MVGATASHLCSWRKDQNLDLKIGVVFVWSWQRPLGEKTMKSLNFTLHDSKFDAPSFSSEQIIRDSRGALHGAYMELCAAYYLEKLSIGLD